MRFPEIPTRIVAAPMAGGPTTAALVAAVGAAGGLGMLAAGYKTADAVRAEIEAVRALQDAGVSAWITITDPAEAAVVPAVDALVVQGWEAGAHRGGLDDADREHLGLLPMLRLVRHRTDLPLVAAGGIADGTGLAAVLAAGADAAMLGTAFLRCPEAGTSPPHRAALGSARPSVVTRAFTGRRARALRNGFLEAVEQAAVPDPPAAYPEIHYVTAPIRAAARQAGDAGDINLWAGQAHALTRELPAGELVAALVDEARAALCAATDRL